MVNQEIKRYRVLNLPSTGLISGTNYELYLGGGQYRNYVVNDSNQLVAQDSKEFIECDTVDDLRNLDSRQIWAIQNGYYKGVTLNGYYNANDTPAPIQYYLSDTSEPDDGGSVFEVAGIKLEHNFVGSVDVRYFGVIPSISINNNITSNFQNAIDCAGVGGSIDIVTQEGEIIYIDGTLYFYDFQIFDGFGWSQITQRGGAVTDFAPKKIGVSRTTFIILKGLTIVNSDISLWNNPLCVGLDFQEVSHFTLENVRIRDHHTNIKHGGVLVGVLGGYYNSVINCELANAFISVDALTNANTTRYIGGRIHSNRIGVRTEKLNDLTFNLAFERNRIGIHALEGTSTIKANCRWEGNNLNQPIANMEVSNGVATVTSMRHFLVDGDEVIISGASNEDINGIKTIINSTSSTYQFETTAEDGIISGSIQVRLSDGGAALLEDGTFGIDLDGHFSSGVNDKVISKSKQNRVSAISSGIRISGGSGVRSILYNSDFSIDSDSNGIADGWSLSASTPTGMTLSLDASVKSTGICSQKITVAPTGTSRRDLIRRVRTVAGCVYSYTIVYKTDTSKTWSARIGSSSGGTQFLNATLQYTKEGFSTLSGYFVATSENTYITIYMNANTASGDGTIKNIWLDSFSLVSGLNPTTDGAEQTLTLKPLNSPIPTFYQEGELFYNPINKCISYATNTDIVDIYNATTTVKGLVNQSAKVDDVSTTPPSPLSAQTVTTIEEAQTAIDNLVTMVNEMQANEVELKAKLNAKLIADRASGQQSTT